MSCSPVFGGLLPCAPLYLVPGCYQQPQTISDTSIEKGLVGYLTANPGVSCVLGSRIYARRAPRTNAVYPLLTYRVHKDHANGLAGSLGYATATLELDIWGDDYEDVATAAEAVRRALQGFSGWWGCVGVASVTLDDDEDSDERPGDSSNVWYYQRSLDFAVIFMEPVPKF